MLGGGVLVLLLVVVLVTGTLGGRPSKPHAGTPRASAAPTGTRAGTPSAAPTAAESATPPPAAPALPDGWQMYHDPTGFTVAAPTGWTVSKEGSILYFRDGTRVLGIDQTDQPHWNPVADWTNQESQRAHTYYPGHQRIRDCLGRDRRCRTGSGRDGNSVLGPWGRASPSWVCGAY